ncbi:MAG: hypothetical protein B6D68_01325 [spirochete symbiont of Stewartia floridana]|nr:MAG: hypothetical protein B6D68_01325 [spirochete symbiont of Stewartia floridana]
MKSILVFGTFDALHPGHRWFLRHAAALGGRLTAVVARDCFVKSWKGQYPVFTEQARMSALRNSGLADQVLLADERIRTYEVLRKIKPDIICLGHDQQALYEDIKSHLNDTRLQEHRPQIIVLQPWRRRRYSSTRIKASKQWGLYALMIFAMAAFGFSWVSGKRLSAAMGPANLAFIRFLCTALACLPLTIFRKRHPHKKLKDGLPWVLMAASCLAVYNLMFFLALRTSLAGKGGLIVTTMNPLFTLLIMSAAAKRPLRCLSIVGAVLGLAAGILLAEPWNYTKGELADPGNLIFMGAALLWSVMTIAARKAQGYMGFTSFMVILYMLASILVLPFALTESGRLNFTGHGMAFWLDMLIISVAVGAYGTGMYFYASKKLGANRGSAFTYLVPASAIIFTWIILGETPRLLTLLGGLLAVIAFVIINFRGEAGD